MDDKKIMLIADDTQTGRELLASFFSDDYEIIYACDGEETVKLIEKYSSKIAMVLLDIIMPMMDGIEVLKWLSASKYNGIPVIAVTAEPSYQLEALENGAWDFIAKPVASSIIKARVNNVLSRCTFERIRDDMGAPLTPATFQRLLSMTELYSCLVSESQSAIYVSGTDTYDLLFINDAGLAWLGKDGKNYSGKKCYEFLFNRTSPCEFCQTKSMSTDSFLERDYFYPRTGRTYFMRGKRTQWNGINAHVEYLLDVTENRNAMRENAKLTQQLTLNQLMYEVAIKSSGINIWEYDIQNDSLFVVSNSQRIKQNCFHIENYIESTIKNGYVREDSIATFRSIFTRLQNGEHEITEDIWYKTTDELGWWCERVTYTACFDENGKPLKAFGAGRDVTREKEAEKKFYEEMSYREALQSGNLASVKINLTKNLVIECSSPFKTVKKLSNATADEYFSKTASYMSHKSMRKAFSKLFNRAMLLNKFNTGEYVVTLDATRAFDTQKVYWINYTVHLMKNPDSNDIFAYVSSTDITHEKVMQTIMSTVAKTDYDFFVVVNGSTNSALDYGVDDAHHLFCEDENFEERNEAYIRGCVCPADVERVVEECKIDTVWKNLENDGVRKLNFSMRDKNGEIRRKQLQLTLIDKSRKTFLMKLIDVNNIYVEQETAKKRLLEALNAAEQANKVKTDFLARMSHDIRTPMNAVICLANLGQTYPDIDETHDCLKKIEASGQYLLAIINDVLNLSKMESQTIVFHPTVVRLQDFIRETLAIVMPSANEKALRVEVTQIGITSKYVKLDTTYTRQVAVNLLSNAIKFTPHGGLVQIIFENISRADKFVRGKMIVKDNGVGISRKFLPRVFAPFEQENAQDDAGRQGTGLGLSIVKNIVEQMGGTVSVESEKGKGTAFTVEWSLEVADENEFEGSSPQIAARLASLAGKRVLLVEDHPLNTEIATKLLEREKMLVEDTANGKEAVERFEASETGYYDAILMDIRMPVMNGLDAAKTIRALPRPDAATVPIIAMTANAFDEDVKTTLESGMNAHLSKPIEPNVMYDTLSKFIK